MGSRGAKPGSQNFLLSPVGTSAPGFTKHLWEGTLLLTLSMAGVSHLMNHHMRLFWMLLGSAKFWDETQ